MATAKPSILYVVDYLTNYFVRFLPTAKCLGCDKKLACKLKESADVDKMRPERSYCAHWMHYSCFETYVNEPPFLRKCPHPECPCENFGSPDFKVDPASVKSREKVFMQQEEKKGEEDDMNKLLGF